MRRVNYHLTEDQLKRLRAESDRTGMSVAELIRRAVDAQYPEKTTEAKHARKRRKAGGR